MISSACWIASKPLGVELSALAIRTTWATHQNSFETKLLFAEDGVLVLAAGPGYHAQMIDDLLNADAELYCVREDLLARGMSEDDVKDGIEIIDASAVAELCEDCETVNYF